MLTNQPVHEKAHSNAGGRRPGHLTPIIPLHSRADRRVGMLAEHLAFAETRRSLSVQPHAHEARQGRTLDLGSEGSPSLPKT